MSFIKNKKLTKRNKLKIFLFFIILFFSMTTLANNDLSLLIDGVTHFETGWNLLSGEPATYFGTTDKTFTAAWNPVIITCPGDPDPVPCGTVAYEVELYHVEQERTIKLGTIAETEITIQLPRTGHYIVRLRTVNTDLEDSNEFKYSEWTVSSSNVRAIVNDEPNGWWIYGYVASPGLIQFNF